jgi:hypothetical protein
MQDGSENWHLYLNTVKSLLTMRRIFQRFVKKEKNLMGLRNKRWGGKIQLIWCIACGMCGFKIVWNSENSWSQNIEDNHHRSLVNRCQTECLENDRHFWNKKRYLDHHLENKDFMKWSLSILPFSSTIDKTYIGVSSKHTVVW